jgi:metal-responsive CopG/Arc/MetJ family transcriptional regulator
MRMTLSIPDAVAHRFQAAVPARQRSRLVTRLLEHELSERDNSLAAACRAANRNRALSQEIDEWQAFDDGIEE